MKHLLYTIGAIALSFSITSEVMATELPDLYKPPVFKKSDIPPAISRRGRLGDRPYSDPVNIQPIVPFLGYPFVPPYRVAYPRYPVSPIFYGAMAPSIRSGSPLGYSRIPLVPNQAAFGLPGYRHRRAFPVMLPALPMFAPLLPTAPEPDTYRLK